MNTNRLNALYDHLAVWERIRLLISAQARNDDTEYQRLFHASPLRSWCFSEHLLAEQALHVLTLSYITEQLDTAGTYFFSMFQLLREEVTHHQELSLAANTSAYIFVVNSQAWQQFCGELGICPSALIASNQHGWFLPYCEEQMATVAPTADELLTQLRGSGKEAKQLITSATVVARWRKLLGEMTQHAPVAPPASGSRVKC